MQSKLGETPKCQPSVLVEIDDHKFRGNDFRNEDVFVFYCIMTEHGSEDMETLPDGRTFITSVGYLLIV